VIGQLWALGVVAEIGIFLWLHRMSQRFALHDLLWLSLLLATLRWIVIGTLPQHVSALAFAQILHAASFGIYHAVAIQLIHRYFVGKNQGRGHALYSSLGFGAGGAAGALYAGYMWQGVGATATFLVAAALSATAMLISLRWLRSPAPTTI
jgi:PPP family 3-phenylpropionic acid transporter